MEDIGATPAVDGGAEDELLARLAVEASPSELVILGMRWEAKAVDSADEQTSRLYIAQATESFKRAEEEARVLKPEPDSPPFQEEVVAACHRNLMPLLASLAIEDYLAELPEVEDAYNNFVSSLVTYVRLARPIFKTKLSDSRLRHAGELAGTFNVMAAVGLWLRNEFKGIRKNESQALLGFFDEPITGIDSFERAEAMPHMQIFTQYQFHREKPERLLQAYVRSTKASFHSPDIDKDVMVIWVGEDLRVPGERLADSPTIISELGNEKGKQFKLQYRTERLEEALEKRTMGALREETAAKKRQTSRKH